MEDDNIQKATTQFFLSSVQRTFLQYHSEDDSVIPY